jgi:hypothetical protein
VGIRETLNDNPRLTTGVTVGIIVVVLGIIFWSMRGSAPAGAGTKASNQAFFSDDDGKTYFADDAKKLPPFDHNGKEAVLARVYRCGGKPFVNHLERYTPDAKTQAEATIAKNNGASNDPTLLEAIRPTGYEVKAPGQKEWIKFGDPRAGEVQRPKCDKPDELEVVSP